MEAEKNKAGNMNSVLRQALETDGAFVFQFLV